MISIFKKKHLGYNYLKYRIIMHCFWPGGNVKKSRYRYSLCCVRETTENFCPWALAPDTKFSLVLLPSFTGGLLSHKCHPPFLWKETGNRALSHLQTQPDTPHMFTIPRPEWSQMAMHNYKGAMGVQAGSSMATRPENSWGNLRLCTKWKSGYRVNS